MRKKGRSQATYENKIREITKWYNGIVNHRQETDGKGKTKEPLKSLDYFLDKLKKPMGA